MKRLFLLSILLAFGFVLTPLFASTGDLFQYDKEKIETEFASLTELEIHVLNNPSTSLTALQSENSNLLEGLELYSPYAMGMNLDSPPLGIPSFLWGCVFGVVGVVVVYIVTDEDRDETKKAFYGCIVSSLVGGVVYVIAYSSIFAAAAI